MIQTGREQNQNTYCWIILAAAFVILFMIIGARSTLGVFFKSIIADLGWNRGTISMVVAVNIWLGGILTPFAGYVMDRFGARWLFAASLAIYGLGFGLIGLTRSVWYLFMLYGLIMAIAASGASIPLANALVAQWFSDRRRGLAIGINNVGSAIGQLSLVPMSALLLSAFGWRLSHMYLGVALVVLTVPVTLWLPRRQVVVDDNTDAPRRQQASSGPLETQSWRNAIRSAPLWQINAGYFVCGITVALYYTHLIPFATDRGFSVTTAVTTFSLLVASSAVGALAAGALSDRLGRKHVLAMAYLIRAGAYAVLLIWHHEITLYVFAVFGGLSWLATPGPTTALTGEVYGMRALGTLSGISMAVHQIGGGASVWLAGVLYDFTGSYDIVFILAVVALLGATLISLVIPERRYSVRHLSSTTSTAGA